MALERRKFTHGVAGAFAEDHTFQERIAGQAVSAVDACTRDFAGGVESGYVGATVEVGLDSAHGVVGGGVDGGRLGAEVDSVVHAGFVDAWEAMGDVEVG